VGAVVGASVGASVVGTVVGAVVGAAVSTGLLPQAVSMATTRTSTIRTRRCFMLSLLVFFYLQEATIIIPETEKIGKDFLQD
jgi:hypothetical protein